MHLRLINIPKKYKYLIAGITIIATVFCLYSYFLVDPGIRIGVMLPLSGPNNIDSKQTLDWAIQKINAEGEINGKSIKLIYKDTNGKNIQKIAKELLSDRAIKIVIGPDRSDQLYAVAPMFIKKKKLLISPMSTADEIAKAFAKKGYIWRTTQSDTAQIRSIINLLKERGVKKVALIFEDSLYGQTFENWFGFFAMEAGIEVTSVSKIEDPIKTVLSGHPEYIIGAVFPTDAVKIKKELLKRNSTAKLFFTDSSQSQYLLDKLGQKAIGIEVSSPAADPSSGFEETYHKTFGFYPWDFSATTYDALLLAIYTQARNRYANSKFQFENINQSMEKIVFGKGEVVSWNNPQRAISLIMKGKSFNISGASGPLDYDRDYKVDPVNTYYAFSKVEQRDTLDFYTFARASSAQSNKYGKLEETQIAIRTKASDEFLQKIGIEKKLTLKEKKDLWVVLVATSHKWKNYRHQANALYFYDLLKKNGVSDDHIALMIYDDIAKNLLNPKKGDIHHEINGKNLYPEAVMDYTGKNVNVKTLRSALLNLGSNENSNILIFIEGHGEPGVMDFQGTRWYDKNFTSLINEMYQHKKFRQMLIVVETCYGESMALNLKTPGVMYITSSSKSEHSQAAVHDTSIMNWLTDEFTNIFLKTVEEEPNSTIPEIYAKVYKKVIGSHVRIKNQENFGPLNAPIKDFFRP